MKIVMYDTGFGPLTPRIGEAVYLLTLLAHPTRLAVLCSLAEREHTVSELTIRLGLPQPVLSQHLTKLRQSGVIVARRSGKHLHYRHATEDVQRLLATLQHLFCSAKMPEPGTVKLRLPASNAAIARPGLT